MNDAALVRNCFYAKGVDLSPAEIRLIVSRWLSFRAVDVERAESMAQLSLRFLHSCSELRTKDWDLEVLQDSDEREQMRELRTKGYGAVYERLSEQCLVLVMEAVMSSCR